MILGDDDALSTNTMSPYQQLELIVACSLAAPARAARKGLLSKLPSKYNQLGLTHNRSVI